MKKIKISELKEFTYRLLIGTGVNPDHAHIVTDVFIRSTLRGVGHHDIYDLPGRLKNCHNGKINPNPTIELIQKYEATERYEGDNGLGELCCSVVMERAKELADEYGIGLCTIRHSNHFLAAAPYTEKALEEGYLALVYTKAGPGMSAPGGTKNVIGNNPMGYGIPTNKEFPLMLDVAMAYTSFGKLHAKIRDGESVPAHWGKDAAGTPTTDPKKIRDGGSMTPMAEHKGFGLSLLHEALTGALSGGQVIDEKHPDRSTGVDSQTAIAIKVDGLIPLEDFKQRTGDMMDVLWEKDAHIHMPGQRSHQHKLTYEEEGITLTSQLQEELNQWARDLDVTPLS